MAVWIWSAIGALLVLFELLLPGYFLVFPAAGAFVVGLAELLGLHGLEPQLGLFAASSLLLFAVSLRHYRRLLRGRPASRVNMPDRLVGGIGVVEDPIRHGTGKIRLGDSLWLARGPDLDKGRAVTVVKVEGTVLSVEARE